MTALQRLSIAAAVIVAGAMPLLAVMEAPGHPGAVIVEVSVLAGSAAAAAAGLALTMGAEPDARPSGRRSAPGHGGRAASATPEQLAGWDTAWVADRVAAEQREVHEDALSGWGAHPRHARTGEELTLTDMPAVTQEMPAADKQKLPWKPAVAPNAAGADEDLHAHGLAHARTA